MVMEFIDDSVWKPVHLLPGFECCIEYYVNCLGELKSTKGVLERILKQRINKNGYYQVNLTQRIGRKQTITVAVHKLVALAFLETPATPLGRSTSCTKIKHINGNKLDNRIDNLKWTKIEKSNT